MKVENDSLQYQNNSVLYCYFVVLIHSIYPDLQQDNFFSNHIISKLNQWPDLLLFAVRYTMKLFLTDVIN